MNPQDNKLGENLSTRTGGDGGEEKRDEMPVLQIINERNQLFSIKSGEKREIHSLEIIWCSKYIRIIMIGKRRVRVLLHCSSFQPANRQLVESVPLTANRWHFMTVSDQPMQRFFLMIVSVS